MKTSISISNGIKPPPRWFRKFKKIFENTENAAIILLMATGHTQDSFLILCIKTGTSVLLSNMETLLANGEEYKKSDDANS